MLQRANLAETKSNLDRAMFFVEAIKRISCIAIQNDRQNDLDLLLKGSLERGQTVGKSKEVIAAAKALLPIWDLEPWIYFLAETFCNQSSSRPSLLQNSKKLNQGFALISRTALH